MTETKEFWAERISYLLFLALGFFLPIWSVPLGFSLELNKTFFVYFLLLFAFIFWLTAKIKQGRLDFSKNLIFLSLAFLIAVFFVSGVFSFNPNLTLFGAFGESGTWLSLVFLGLSAFLASEILKNSERAFFWILTLFISSILVFVFQALKIGFGITFYPWPSFFPSLTSNLIGSWNNFGLFFGAIGLLALYFYEISQYLTFKLLFLALFVISLIVLFFVNFSLLWWFFGILTIILGTYIFIFRKEKIFSPLIGFGLALVLFFIITPNLASNLTSSISGVTNIEVRPSHSATFDILKQSLRENPVLGLGPNTFLENWLKHKPSQINNTVFWNARFESGASFFSSLAVSSGGLGLIAVLFFILSYIYSGLRFGRLIEVRQDYLIPLVSFLASFYFFILMLFYSPNFLNLLLGFIFLGIFVGSATERNIFSKIEIALFQTSGVGFISSLILIFSLLLSFSGLYFLAQKYIGNFYYARGLELFNFKGDVFGAKLKLGKAVGFDPEPQYYRSLVQLNLIELNNLFQKTDLTPEEFRQNLQIALSETIQNALRARELNPRDSLNWLALGQVYEALLPVKIGQAADTARQIYREAFGIFPTNPEILLSLARLEFQADDLKAARNYLDQTISMKPDYSAAHFLYAQLESRAGNRKQAISRAETTVLISPNDIGSLFQLGILYYDDGQFENAKAVLMRLTNLAPNYSNGRYFLGLIYDREGKTKEALAEFDKILTLNPDNSEVKKIIANLQAGRKALSGASSPIERKNPPLEER